MNANVFWAVMRRNFVAYFTNPTGYLFICVFVGACSMATFFPHEFFNARLANLEQLNGWFPWIMVAFTPAITMGIWADERRQGTDELLLTIPAGDVDIVLGKYAATVAIYSVSLVLSMLSSIIMLTWMGDPDYGLLVCNHFGYWLVGLAMLAIGMMASFLTGNLTISYVFGVLLNLPLVGIGHVGDWLPRLAQWSIAAKMADYGRGLLSLPSAIYFILIAVTMLYLCTVLIGRRHWLGGRDGKSMLGHYLLRATSLAVVAAGVIALVGYYFPTLAADVTTNRVNSLSPDTRTLLADLNAEEIKKVEKERDDLAKQQTEAEAKKDDKQADDKKPDDKKAKEQLDGIKKKLRQKELELKRLDQPIHVEAYISRDVPEAYVRTKLDLLSGLNAFRNLSGGKITVEIFDDVEPRTPRAKQAEDRHGISTRLVRWKIRGVETPREIVLGAAFTSGEKKVVVDFFELGIPVEYELLRSVMTLSQTKRYRLGVVNTEAPLLGGPDFTMMRNRPDQQIIAELKKYMTVEQVDPLARLNDAADKTQEPFDVLLAVQPSMLSQPAIENLMDAIARGVPTVIFEDPYPYFSDFRASVAGTDRPKMPAHRGGMGMTPPPTPKGDIEPLWRMLGVQLLKSYFRDRDEENRGALAAPKLRSETAIVWQQFNPYPKVRSTQEIMSEWVFVRDAQPGGKEAFGDDPITRGLHELLFLMPGAFQSRKDRPVSLEFKPLVTTGTEVGVISFEDLDQGLRTEDPHSVRSREQRVQDEQGADLEIKPLHLAVRVDGTPNPETLPPVLTNPAEASRVRPVHVVLASDIDMLHSAFFNLRANPHPELKFQFQNVAFVLNAIDSLANDNRYLEIRKRRQYYGELTRVRAEEAEVDKHIAGILKSSDDKYSKETELAQKRQAEAEKELDDTQQRMQKEGGDLSQQIAAIHKAQFKSQAVVRETAATILRLRRQRDREIDKKLDDREKDIRAMEDQFKMLAILLPPIPPLIVAAIVFITRRAREKEGVEASRLR